MANGIITWNGVSSDGLGIIVRKVPSLNRPRRKHESYSVPGRNGNIVVMQDAYEEYEQDYEIFMLDDAQTDARTIADWLFQDGYCELKDDWEPNHYRLAYFVGPLDIETILEEAAVCTVTFRCRPERYLVTSEIIVENGESITNPTNHIAKPIIKLTGSGARSLLKLSGRTNDATGMPTGNYSQLAKFIPSADSQWKVFDFADDDRYVRLLPVTAITANTITNTNGAITFTANDASAGYQCGVGIIMNVEPNTDYTLSGEGLGSLSIGYAFAEAEGYNKVTEIHVYSVYSSTAWTPFSYTFRTPSNCGYILLNFAKRTPATGDSFSLRKLMLNKGQTAITFREYVTAPQSTITVGGTVLHMTGTFDECAVDCERENVTMDGANANPGSSVTDSFGNESVDFLQLNVGGNNIAYDGEITAVTIEPRFWQL
jgi:phage-related protein